MSAANDSDNSNLTAQRASMPPEAIVEQRKADHIRINVEEDVSFKNVKNGLDSYYFMHEALPELDFADIDTRVTLLGKSLKVPVVISSMTGGADEAYKINVTLAKAAQETGIAMGLGSVRAAIEDRNLSYTYQVRKYAPDILLFANLGAVQLNYGYGLDECLLAVEICQADALILHFNVLQEAVQPEGDGDFSGLLRKVEQVCRQMPVPVIAKEVGWGFSESTARRLASAGIAAIDVAGAGGTSWSQVEMHRAPTPRHARVAGSFIDWGIPTADAVQYCRSGAPGLPVIASGGMRNGIDVAKCIALGASAAGFAGQFLRAAVNGGVDGVIETAGMITDELRVAMFASGAGDIAALTALPLYRRS
jgi:isopentenyl-diphosphate delta-isomerase